MFFFSFPFPFFIFPLFHLFPVLDSGSATTVIITTTTIPSGGCGGDDHAITTASPNTTHLNIILPLGHFMNEWGRVDGPEQSPPSLSLSRVFQ